MIRPREWYVEQSKIAERAGCPEMAKFLRRRGGLEAEENRERWRAGLFILGVLAAAAIPSAILAILASLQ